MMNFFPFYHLVKYDDLFNFFQNYLSPIPIEFSNVEILFIYLIFVKNYTNILINHENL